ncbi:MAG TPA: low molecular weight protein-tyrosine-phosphatase [Longimicrobiales bacterium]|nr:low molecular weight protein-tyrosine-phosphatase [Longimicrobiales bacterium]
MSDRIRVLFVCLGNICRSPLAEAVFRDTVERHGLGNRFDIDSAGTSDYHIGEGSDPRTVETAARRGVKLEHSGRQLTASDLEHFDYVLAMDASNLGKIERLARQRRGRAEVHLLRAFDAEAGDDLEVPDPYFGGTDGFERVHDMIERASAGLLDHIRAQHAL